MIPYIVIHEAKSKYAYLYDKDTLHLRLQVQKGKANNVRVIYGDPFRWGPSKEDPKVYEWKLDSAEYDSMTLEGETQHFDHFFISIKPPFKRVKYAFIIDEHYVVGARETVDFKKYPDALKDHFNFFNFPFLDEADLFKAPSWVSNQIWYSIFPERFRNGNPSLNPPGTLPWGETDEYSNQQRFGGDLEGIIESLDYIKDIGFTGIYMTPIFESDSNHKYDINDYFSIDKHFGDNKTLGRLVNEAHKKGLKIMLDAVYNHCGFRHPFFQDVVKNGKNSPYYDCFYIIDSNQDIVNFKVDEDGRINKDSVKEIFNGTQLPNYHTFAFTPFMPKMNVNNPVMKQHLLDAATYWIKTYDIDGWRLDVSNEVSHKFWREFRQVVKATKPEAYIVGENWDSSIPWLQGDQYDAVMNYEMLFPIWRYFGTNHTHPPMTKQEFIYAINRVLYNYPKHVIEAMYNLLDSHDTARILEACNNNKQLVLLPYVFLFSLPGSPSIYYGGEINLGGKHDPDNRRCMIWDPKLQDQNMLSFIKTIIHLRKHYIDFSSTEISWHQHPHNKNTLLYQKGSLYFILHNTLEETEIVLPDELSYTTVKDIFYNEDLNLDKTITLSNYDFLILQKQ